VSTESAPLAGVTVSATGAISVTTDANGRYVIYIPGGSVEVSWNKTGYKPLTHSVTGAVNKVQKLDLTMEPKTGGGTPGFTVAPGKLIEKRVSSPGRLEFDITGVPPVDAAAEKAHIAWGYEVGKSWTGGSGSGGAEFGLRLYKSKCYSLRAKFAGEQRYNFPWTKDKKVHVIIEWTRSMVRTNVGGSITEIAGSYPAEWTVGIGWPPSSRPGVQGAVYTNVKWP
jgi:hypothetical protein